MHLNKTPGGNSSYLAVQANLGARLMEQWEAERERWGLIRLERSGHLPPCCWRNPFLLSKNTWFQMKRRRGWRPSGMSCVLPGCRSCEGSPGEVSVPFPFVMWTRWRAFLAVLEEGGRSDNSGLKWRFLPWYSWPGMFQSKPSIYPSSVYMFISWLLKVMDAMGSLESSGVGKAPSIS